MVMHSSVLAWRILWTEEPSRLQSIGSQRVGLKRLSTQAWGIEKRGGRGRCCLEKLLKPWSFSFFI